MVHSDRSPFFTSGQFTLLVSVSFLRMIGESPRFGIHPSFPFLVSVQLMAIPYGTFVLFTIAGIVVGAHSTVARRNFYCLTDDTRITTASAAVSAFYLFTTCLFLAWTVFIVYRRYRESRKFGREQIGTDVPLFLRVLSFGIFIFLAFVYASFLFSFPLTSSP